MSEGTGNPGSPGNSGPGVSKRSEGMRIGRARKKRLSCLSAVRICFLFTAASGNAAGTLTVGRRSAPGSLDIGVRTSKPPDAIASINIQSTSDARKTAGSQRSGEILLQEEGDIGADGFESQPVRAFGIEQHGSYLSEQR